MTHTTKELTSDGMYDAGGKRFENHDDAERYAKKTGGVVYTCVSCDEYVDTDGVTRDFCYVEGEVRVNNEGVYAVIPS